MLTNSYKTRSEDRERSAMKKRTEVSITFKSILSSAIGEASQQLKMNCRGASTRRAEAPLEADLKMRRTVV